MLLWEKISNNSKMHKAECEGLQFFLYNTNDNDFTLTVWLGNSSNKVFETSFVTDSWEEAENTAELAFLASLEHNIFLI